MAMLTPALAKEDLDRVRVFYICVCARVTSRRFLLADGFTNFNHDPGRCPRYAHSVINIMD